MWWNYVAAGIADIICIKSAISRRRFVFLYSTHMPSHIERHILLKKTKTSRRCCWMANIYCRPNHGMALLSHPEFRKYPFIFMNRCVSMLSDSCHIWRWTFEHNHVRPSVAIGYQMSCRPILFVCWPSIDVHHVIIPAHPHKNEQKKKKNRPKCESKQRRNINWLTFSNINPQYQKHTFSSHTDTHIFMARQFDLMPCVLSSIVYPQIHTFRIQIIIYT